MNDVQTGTGELTLYSTVGCHLCEEAEALLASALATGRGRPWRVVDIADDGGMQVTVENVEQAKKSSRPRDRRHREEPKSTDATVGDMPVETVDDMFTELGRRRSR